VLRLVGLRVLPDSLEDEAPGDDLVGLEAGDPALRRQVDGPARFLDEVAFPLPGLAPQRRRRPWGVLPLEELLEPVEFLALLVPHVLLRYEVTIRLYGAVSTTFRLKAGWIKAPPVKEPPPERPPPPPLELEPPLTTPEDILPPPHPAPPPPPSQSALEGHDPQDGDFHRARKRNWARLIQKVWLQDPTLCASCGLPMRIIAAISSPAQDDVIEKILRQLDRWDPPWKRHRKARGPPASRSAPSSPGPEAFDLGPDVDQYCRDPPPNDDSWT